MLAKVGGKDIYKNEIEVFHKKRGKGDEKNLVHKSRNQKKKKEENFFQKDNLLHLRFKKKKKNQNCYFGEKI